VHVKKTTLRAMRISRSTNVSSCLAALSGSIIGHSPISFNNRTDTKIESRQILRPSKSLAAQHLWHALAVWEGIPLATL
jgi:hypothetical protein